MTNERLYLNDFGMAILSALHLKGVKLLSDHDLPKLHQAFEKAYKVVEKELGPEVVRFYLRTSSIHGTSPDVNSIMLHWLGPWATRDSPGTIWRLRMDDATAEKYLQEFPGEKELWLKAADTFLENI